MLKIEFNGNTVILNKPEDFSTYMKLYNSYEHDIAQIIITTGVSPHILDNGIVEFQITEQNLLEIDKILNEIAEDRVSNFLEMMAVRRNKSKKELKLLTDAAKIIETLHIRDLSIDYDRTKESLASEITPNTILYFYNVDFIRVSVGIKDLFGFSFDAE